MTPGETALRELLMRLRDVHPDDLSPSVRRLRAAWIDTGCYGIDPDALRIEGAAAMRDAAMGACLRMGDCEGDYIAHRMETVLDPATVVREVHHDA